LAIPLVDSTPPSVKMPFKFINFGVLFISPKIFRQTEFRIWEVPVGIEVAPFPALPVASGLNGEIF
jgi:hypothetical protein